MCRSLKTSILHAQERAESEGWASYVGSAERMSKRGYYRITYINRRRLTLGGEDR